MMMIMTRTDDQDEDDDREDGSNKKLYIFYYKRIHIQFLAGSEKVIIIRMIIDENCKSEEKGLPEAK